MKPPIDKIHRAVQGLANVGGKTFRLHVGWRGFYRQKISYFCFMFFPLKSCQYLLSILFFLTLSASAQQKKSSVPIDFFSDSKKLFCWSGPFSSNSTFVKALPLMQYYDKKNGSARIVCFPKNGADNWEKQTGSLDAKRRDLKVREIIKDTNFQKSFNIHVFLVEPKYLVTPDEEPSSLEEKIPKAPMLVHVYKRGANGWQYIRKVFVKNWDEYSNLETRTVIPR